MILTQDATVTKVKEPRLWDFGVWRCGHFWDKKTVQAQSPVLAIEQVFGIKAMIIGKQSYNQSKVELIGDDGRRYICKKLHELERTTVYA